MMMNENKQRLKYIISDFISGALSWTIFYIFRKLYIEPKKFGYSVPLTFDEKYYLGIFILPFFWLLLYYATGYYKDVYRKSRLQELGQTLFMTLIGVIFIFFSIILDDTILTYRSYYLSISMLFIFHFFITYIPRLIITTNLNHKIHKREIGFNTVIIGSYEKAVEIYKEIESLKRSTGNKFIGFINVNDKNGYLLSEYIPHLGSLSDLNNIISKYNIKEVIIAIESSEHNEIGKIINKLYNYNVIIKIIPDIYNILAGQVKMSTILGTPLIEISHELMPVWQEKIKYILDKIISLLALIISLPIILIAAIGIKLTSKGPIIFKQERIGRYGKAFTLYKFRSMYVDAENRGPALASKYDNRITPFGQFLRKTKIDEIPNFINVLKGDMSIVGPRPERKYFIDQIVARAPHYLHLQKVKPGVTSWGQVKYGYAENVDQMIERMKYDLLYIENISLYVDFKIMIYTILKILKGNNI